MDGLRNILSTDELIRSERSPLVHEQNRFVAGRGSLRQILASYLDIHPAEVQFAYGHAGKPYLVNATRDLRFNVSHSGDLALIAVSLQSDIGVDVEFMCDIPEMTDIVSRFFPDSAKDAFFSATPAKRMSIFYKCWTEKEAVSKCTGVGITEEESQPHHGIALMPLAPARGYAASLAMIGYDLNVRTWHWNRTLAGAVTAHATAAATGVFL